MSEPGLPCVLIVDDSAASRTLASAILSGLALRVDEAADGVTAFEMLLSGRFNLLITDLNMAPIDGRQLVLAACLLKPRPKIVICSSNHDAQDSYTRLAIQNADKVLAKPVSAGGLISAVTMLLPVAEAREEMADSRGPPSPK